MHVAVLAHVGTRYCGSAKKRLMTGVIYKIFNKANGRAYFGSTIHEKKRLATHLRHLRKGKHKNRLLQRDFDVFGEDSFEFSVIERDVPENDLHIYELSEIVAYDTENSYDGFGVYNIGKARRVTAEQRRKRPKRKVRNAFFSSLH